MHQVTLLFFLIGKESLFNSMWNPPLLLSYGPLRTGIKRASLENHFGSHYVLVVRLMISSNNAKPELKKKHHLVVVHLNSFNCCVGKVQLGPNMSSVSTFYNPNFY